MSNIVDAANYAGIEFLEIELSLAHTFLDIAESATRPEQRLQSHDDARKACRAVLYFMPRLQLTAEQKTDFERQLAELNERLAFVFNAV